MKSDKKIDFSIPVDHVSETAYMVSAYRLVESRRSDRHFDDSMAAKLLGESPDLILNRLSMWKLGEWTMAVRTTLVDRMILKLVQEGVTTVVNLAAGLDTRPYRLPLPKGLNWIEADLAGIIQFKNKKLEKDQPVCQLKRIVVDLADAQQRANFFSTFQELDSFIILTEGLLLYLDPKDVENLSKDLMGFSGLRAWLTDITTAASFRVMGRVSGQDFTTQKEANSERPENSLESIQTEENRVQFKFLPDEGIRYFEHLGWKVEEFQSYYDYGKILNRNFPIELSPSDLDEILEVGIGRLIK